MVSFGGPTGSPKVTTVLQRRALAMNPRYIFVVSYQISSNMVASATAPLRWRVFVLVSMFSVFVSWSLQDCSCVRVLLDHEVTLPVAFCCVSIPSLSFPLNLRAKVHLHCYLGCGLCCLRYYRPGQRYYRA